MLEASSHKHLKLMLKKASLPWPHSLTLSRLVARSLRRNDHTWIQMGVGSHDLWWLGLLIPVCLANNSLVIVLSEPQRRRLVKKELPILNSEGFDLNYSEGCTPPPNDHLWLLSSEELITAHRMGYLESKQLIILEAEKLSQKLRKTMAIVVEPNDWEVLFKSESPCSRNAISLYQRLTKRLFGQCASPDGTFLIDATEIFLVKNLLNSLDDYPDPWRKLLTINPTLWASWAKLDYKSLRWNWHFEPIEPFENLVNLFTKRPVIFLTESDETSFFEFQLREIKLSLDVVVKLNNPNVQEPIPIFTPRSQPLPNTELFSKHLLDQCRRLIIGLSGLTIVLLDDSQLRISLTASLAAEFGRRVSHEKISSDINGIICCSWDWWIHSQHELPLPRQVIFALLPLASLELPLTAARVDAMKRKGRDWFREFLLPEALTFIPLAVAPIRKSGGRLAILDGRVRSRSWGKQILRSLEPWIPLYRLLPN